ncbi:MAG: family 43 glycosylhydrolase [Aristaeellaceae bacterium]
MQIRNPILPGFHPDPCALRVGDRWYVATSTFEWYPGVEIHSSPDLVHWTLEARPLTEPLVDLSGVPNSGGVWAPCLTYDRGIWWLVYSITRTFDETTQDTENYVTWARNLQGPWAPRVRIHSGGFDASMFHAPDGTHWIVGMRWNSRVEQDHFAGIWLQQYDPDKPGLTGEAKRIFRGTSLGLTEGPHLYFIDGWYYLMVAEGGTSTDHAVTVARSRHLDHGYEPDPAGPMLTSRDHPDWPIQYAGHGSLVRGDDGAWYLFHLGARKALFGGWSVLGRETFVQNVVWQSGWPRLRQGGHLPAETFDAPGDASAAPLAPVRITFPDAPLRFASLRGPLQGDMCARPGWLRLIGQESMLSLHRQTLAGTQIDRVPCVCETHLDCRPTHFLHAAGLSLWYHTANFYALLVTHDEALGRCLRLVQRDCRHTRLLHPMIPLPEGEITLRMTLLKDRVTFAYALNGAWREIPAENAPSCILSDEYANRSGDQGFTGCFAALCCQDQTGEGWHADFQYLTLT